MKLSSVVSLILGAIAIVIGIFLCQSAEEAAIADGYNLHQNIFDENGNIEKEYSFSSEEEYDVTKIEVELEGVDIHLIGGAEKSKIVVRNMFGGTYSCNISNKVITITNKMDLSTIFDAAQHIEFNGIRNLFDRENFKKRHNEIFIYLNNTDEEIKQISLNVTNCNVNVVGIEGALDLLVKADSSQLHFSDFITNSSIKCEMLKSDVTFTNVNFANATVNGEESNFKFDSGLVILYRIIATTPGKITANGNEYTNTFSHNENEADFPTIKVDLISGNIDLTFMG